MKPCKWTAATLHHELEVARQAAELLRRGDGTRFGLAERRRVMRYIREFEAQSADGQAVEIEEVNDEA